MIGRKLPAVVFTVAGLGAVGLVAQADTVTSRPVTLMDARSGVSLSIQTAPAAFDGGHFVVRVPGVGSYVGEAGNTMEVRAPNSVIVHFSGAATLRPAAAPDGTIAGTVRTTTTARIDLQAQIDPTHRTGAATLVDGARRYQIVAGAVGRGDLDRTIRAVESAFVADDPLALYPLMSAELRSVYASQAFADTWRAQGVTIGRVTAMRARSIGEPQTNELGFVFVVASYDVDRVTPSGSRDTSAFDVYFVREGSSWKLLFTRRR